MNEHRGNPWEAEMLLCGLEFSAEDGAAQPLGDKHQRLFDELNFQPDHFPRLEALIQSQMDALRVHEHPNCPEELKAKLDSRYQVKAKLKELEQEAQEKESMLKSAKDILSEVTGQDVEVIFR